MSKINPGTILLAFMAILCGLLGMFFAVRPRAMPTVETPTVQRRTVPVASANLVEGRRITLGDIAIMKLSREQMKKRGITASFMANPDQIIGRVLRTPLTLGKPFNTNSLYPEGVGPGIEKKLTAGHRAVTVAVGGNDALLGFATAGSWVDIIFRSGDPIDDYRGNDARYRNRSSNRNRQFNYGVGTDREITLTLIERVEILAIDSNTLNAAPDNPARSNAEDRVSVTLAVTSAQAEKLRVVEGRGQLSLALRAADDDETQTKPQQRTLEDILNRKNVVRQMEVYRGTRFDRITFDNGEKWSSPARTRTAGAQAEPTSADTTPPTTAAQDKPRS